MRVDGTELDVEQTLIRGGLFLTPDMQRVKLALVTYRRGCHSNTVCLF